MTQDLVELLSKVHMIGVLIGFGLWVALMIHLLGVRQWLRRRRWKLKWTKFKGLLWRWKRYAKWVLSGRLCHCGADFRGHSQGSHPWCVFETDGSVRPIER